MKRVLVYISMFFAAGIISGLHTGNKLNINPSFIFGGILIISIYSAIRYLKGRKIFCLLFLILFLTGLMFSYGKLSQFNKFHDELRGVRATVRGQISGDVEIKENMFVYILYADCIEFDGKVIDTGYKVRVVDYENKGDYLIPYNNITLSGAFKENYQYKNTGSTDYNLLMYKDNIVSVFTADYSQSIYSSEDNRRYMEKISYELKQKAGEILNKYTGQVSQGLLSAIMFGDVSGIGEDNYQGFINSGVIHVFAVSGYNIWILYFLLSKILAFLNGLHRIKIIIIIMVLYIYTYIAGATPSVTRAFIMASLILTGRILRRDNDSLTSLSLAATVILIINPLEIMDTGFILSFLSVASIIFLYPKINAFPINTNEGIRSIIVTSMCIQIGTMPVTIYYFNNLSTFSFAANLVVIPLVSLLTVFGLLIIALHFIIPPMAFAIGVIVNYAVQIILYFTGIISSLPLSKLIITTPSITTIIIYYMVIALIFNLIALNEKQKKLFKYLVLAILTADIIIFMLPSPLTIKFVDVGQGDCILISTPDKKNILIDGGGINSNFNSGIDIGEDVVVPYLLRQGINKLDLIISTHADDDHLKGLIPVMECFNYNEFIIGDTDNLEGYKELLEEDLIDEDDISKVAFGECIEVGKEVKLYVYNPIRNVFNDDNDSSVVVKLIYKDFSALFTGDISSQVEKEILKYGIRSDVLKVPHHGSASSLCQEFLDAVSPKTAVICVGKNSYGHPASETLDKINDMGIPLYRTDIDGEVIITTKGRDFKIQSIM
ncbi:ComEC family competence protein [Oxobacter pfennigii]|uniref:ComEC family competence protein n=1 Tax=Oxobacter pfennigii TaxID=36849 RepID=A0A0P8W610_9CLOT|nr:DNA internalization-related competence protein ComEC/Rec2 [Oxobacter pfennigii]KPU44134.1 ComEC family competence protein [Oxobacter pfennigii]